MLLFMVSLMSHSLSERMPGDINCFHLQAIKTIRQHASWKYLSKPFCCLLLCKYVQIVSWLIFILCAAQSVLESLRQ